MDRHVCKTHGKIENRITVESWIEELAKELKPDEVPPGWYSVRTIAKRTGATIDSVDKTMERRAQRGEFEERTFRVIAANNRVVAVKHYRKK